MADKFAVISQYHLQTDDTEACALKSEKTNSFNFVTKEKQARSDSSNLTGQASNLC